MNRVILLKQFKEFSEEHLKDLIMPTRMQRGDEEQNYRSADIHLMRLPDSTAAYKKAPYIIHQLITGKDLQDESTATVRSIFAVYSDNEEEGALMLVNLMERLRISLLRQVVIGDQFQLDLEAGLEIVVYPEDTAPYFAGEMISTWRIPSIQREVKKWL